MIDPINQPKSYTDSYTNSKIIFEELQAEDKSKASP
jgi:hypothetical protein